MKCWHRVNILKLNLTQSKNYLLNIYLLSYKQAFLLLVVRLRLGIVILLAFKERLTIFSQGTIKFLSHCH